MFQQKINKNIWTLHVNTERKKIVLMATVFSHQPVIQDSSVIVMF